MGELRIFPTPQIIDDQIAEQLRLELLETINQYPEVPGHMVFASAALGEIPSFMHGAFGVVDQEKVYDPLPGNRQSITRHTGTSRILRMLRSPNTPSYSQQRQQKLIGITRLLCSAPRYSALVEVTPALSAEIMGITAEDVRKQVETRGSPFSITNHGTLALTSIQTFMFPKARC